MLRKKGFTLLELIIVIIVIGILASIALPRYTNVVNKAKLGTAKHNLSELRKLQIARYATEGNFTATIGDLDIAIMDTDMFNFVTSDSADDTKVATAESQLADPGSDCKVYIGVDGNFTTAGTCNAWLTNEI